MAINNNLYPPIIKTYNPAFLINGDNSKCRIYFSISLYNTLSEISNAQIAISYQNSNKSALYSTRRDNNNINEKPKYPCDIMLTRIYTDNSRISDDKYYIEIANDDLQYGFEINQYYKVQIRFTSVDADEVSLSTPQAIDSWLTSNLSLFSEWSTICLIKGISVPSLDISGLSVAAESTIWSSAESRIVGNLTFADEEEKETLKSYRVKLYFANNEQLVSDSGLQYTNNFVNPNEFVYDFPYDFIDGEDYHLIVEYTTISLYTEIKEYDFTVIQTSGEKLNATISIEADNEEGGVHVHLQGITPGEIFTGNITIRRTSSLHDFKLWEDVYTTTIQDGKELNLDWYDLTVESGVWYLYCAQRRDSLGNRGVVLKADAPVMVDLEYFYLLAEGQQIKIKFDPNISSFKRQVSESKVDTIGSKYPFVKRNGATDYKTFPISGTISHFMDENNFFTSKEEIFGESLVLYDKYNWENRITDYNNYIYERKFRELVSDFLHKNNVKLFRSSTEGNILVKLMDINFTPEAVLGGYIYHFNCTAYEIDECNQTNIDFYRIQSIGTYSETLQYVKDYFGQSQQVFPANKDVISMLQSEYQKYVEDGYIAVVEYLDSLRLEFESKPYLIGEGTSGPYVINDNETTDSNILAAAYLGYLAYINGEPIVINPEGIYELRQDNVKITSLYFPVDTQVSIDYHLQLSQTEDISQLYKSTNYFNRVGQYWGTFAYEDSIYQQIFNKYYEKYSNYMQSLVELNKIKIEADPGTVVYVKESQDSDFERHVIGPSCTLDFSDEESEIQGIYFMGVHLEEATDAEQQRDDIPDNKYIDTGITLYSLENKEKLIKNGVYSLADTALKAINTEEPDSVIVDEEDENIENTGRQLLNDLVRVSPVSYDKEKSQLVVNHNQVEPVLTSGEDDSVALYIEEYNPETAEMTINSLDNIQTDNPNQIAVDSESIEENQETLEEDDYILRTNKEGEWENGVVKAEEDAVPTESTAYIPQESLAAMYYRLLTQHDYDREFAIIIEEIINSATKYIWYNNKWYIFTESHDLICPVEGLIDYYCEIMKGNYA